MARSLVGKVAKFRFVNARGEGERMWVKVTSDSDGRVCGTLDNDPVVVPMRYGQRVCRAKREVLDVASVSSTLAYALGGLALLIGVPVAATYGYRWWKGRSEQQAAPGAIV